jgi:hypothetical protein
MCNELYEKCTINLKNKPYVYCDFCDENIIIYDKNINIYNFKDICNVCLKLNCKY